MFPLTRNKIIGIVLGFFVSVGLAIGLFFAFGNKDTPKVVTPPPRKPPSPKAPPVVVTPPVVTPPVVTPLFTTQVPVIITGGGNTLVITDTDGLIKNDLGVETPIGCWSLYSSIDGRQKFVRATANGPEFTMDKITLPDHIKAKSFRKDSNCSAKNFDRDIPAGSIDYNVGTDITSFLFTHRDAPAVAQPLAPPIPKNNNSVIIKTKEGKTLTITDTDSLIKNKSAEQKQAGCRVIYSEPEWKDILVKHPPNSFPIYLVDRITLPSNIKARTYYKDGGMFDDRCNNDVIDNIPAGSTDYKVGLGVGVILFEAA